jgi:DNA polymerase III delta prime subunit
MTQEQIQKHQKRMALYEKLECYQEVLILLVSEGFQSTVQNLESKINELKDKINEDTL